MKNAIRLVAASALLASAGAVFAQNGAAVAVAAEPRNVVQLSAAGLVEVQQDVLVITLTASKDAPTLAVAQTQLKQALDAALTEAKASAQAGQMDVTTGSFSLSPRYSKDQKIVGWQGQAELTLQGRDFARITTVAGKLQTMAVSNVMFTLSRESRAKAESEAQSQAIEQFKSRAGELSKAFGFAGYGLREVSVSGQGVGVTLMGMVERSKMASFASAPVPVQPGREQVSISVSGTVQMR
ncbi:putative secreted protein [Acidovorax sp. 56]|uniref:SIMPL domain-containing protein n=1 Tax=Acidovorax sp. 56 TaxID=2035205 RepID=UPI000C166FDD|nr:SIMPL domain-containing protein [Acidovorax sp. 56]PIF26307.1 putative secreted protein [Acidovorax sp. 56]